MADEQAEAPAPPHASEEAAAPEPEVGLDPEPEGGLDLDAEQARLAEVEDKIAEGRRTLADGEPDDPPVAAGEGAANAPPG